ncbi:hypothetical protein TIFTF001_001765 [Ficus carica]|uniref:Uncharacterized protein n=1 Tax=Ficus carica TaxID=3494 RepID=A0AA87Z0R0_FICCA|nr:hypothetical protein TIFTF001_001765 [Ficus carica]
MLRWWEYGFRGRMADMLSSEGGKERSGKWAREVVLGNRGGRGGAGASGRAAVVVFGWVSGEEKKGRDVKPLHRGGVVDDPGDGAGVGVRRKR